MFAPQLESLRCSTAPHLLWVMKALRRIPVVVPCHLESAALHLSHGRVGSRFARRRPIAPSHERGGGSKFRWRRHEFHQRRGRTECCRLDARSRGTDSARRPDQFSAGSPSICAWSALVIGELSSNSGQISDARTLSNSPAPLSVWGWNASAASVSGAGPSRDVQPPAVFDVCSACTARQPANERGPPVPHVPRVSLTPSST